MKIIKLKYRAFTLVELLAVIGLIAILSMVVTTSAQRITKEVRLSTALNQVMSAVSEARSIAIRDRTEVLVAFTVPMCLNQTIPQPVLLILRRCAKNLYQ